MIIWSIAKTTVGDALRKKVLQIFLVAAMGLIIISMSFSQSLAFSARDGSAAGFMLVKSFGLGLMAIAGWLISIVMGVSLIPQEIERRTIYTILSKPVKRYEFVVGKFLGAILTLAICVGMMGIVFMGVIAVKAHFAQAPAVSAGVAAAGGVSGESAAGGGIQLLDMNMLYGVILVYMQFLVLTSFVMLFSVFFTPTVNFFMGLGVYVVGLMSSLTETLATSHSGSPLVSGFYWVLFHMIPNFGKYNVTNGLLYPDMAADKIPLHTLGTSLEGILWALIAMLIAVIVFERKEV